MPWNRKSVTDSRAMFIGGWLRGEDSMSRLCEGYGISRRTGCKWVEPLPGGGGRRFGRSQFGAIGTWSIARGLSKPAVGAEGQAFADRSLGTERQLGGGLRRLVSHLRRRSLPFIMTYSYSGYPLASQTVAQVRVAHVQRMLRRLYREQGMPRALRTDSGTPFARRAGLLSRFSVWLLTLADFITPEQPDMNGRHGCTGVLREDTATPPAANLDARQERFDT
jgi:putative transposase